jgi:ACR3 family arsenite efflux pump ArsB
LVVFVPMVAGNLTRTLLVRRLGQQRYKARVAPIFPGFSTVGVLAVVFLAIGLKAEMIVSDPALLLKVIVPLMVFYAVYFAVATGLLLLAAATLILVRD